MYKLYLMLFTLKLIDCILTTLKTKAMIHNKYLLSSILNATATAFYILIIVNLARVDDYISIISVSIATFLGTYVPLIISDKLQPDKIFKYEIVPFSKETGKEIADELRENNIAVQTYIGYYQKDKVLCCRAYSESKCQSKLIEDVVGDKCDYHISEIRNKHINE